MAVPSTRVMPLISFSLVDVDAPPSEVAFVPHTTARAAAPTLDADDPDVVESRKLHRLVDFQEHTRERVFEETMSSIICPVNPSPSAVAFSWWNHAVGALAGNYRKRGRRVEFGFDFVNSYGKNWNGKRRGYGTVWGTKAIPFEAVTVRAVSAVSEEI